jgi:hypothetical protein
MPCSLYLENAGRYVLWFCELRGVRVCAEITSIL